MLPPAPVSPPPNVVIIGATIEKRFPGYGVHRGSIAEIDGGRVVVHWAATDERTTLTLKEAAKRVIPAPSENDEDDQSVTSAAFGIESSATSFTAPRHVLLELDDEGDLQTILDGGARTATSRFWGVHWNRKSRKWMAHYRDADGKQHYIGSFVEEEEAARAVNKAICDAGLEGKRRTNAVDATGSLVPKSGGSWKLPRDRSAVVAPDPARDPTASTSKFWGVTWHKNSRRWQARYVDANNATQYLGVFDTQEQAAHAVNAAIRRAGLEGKRRTNPVVDGQLVPRARKAHGHGRPCDHRRAKRRREELAATPSSRARRPRRAANYAEDPDFEP